MTNQIKSNEDHAKHYEECRISTGDNSKPWDELNGFEKRQYIENVEAQLEKDRKELLEASAPAMTDEIKERLEIVEELSAKSLTAAIAEAYKLQEEIKQAQAASLIEITKQITEGYLNFTEKANALCNEIILKIKAEKNAQ